MSDFTKEEEKENKIKDYRERNKRWQDKTNQQISFFNNLILTLSVGFLSFGYKEIKISELTVYTDTFNLKLTLFVFSLIIISLSICYGLIVALNRLYDFRITAHINQVRHWAMKYSGTLLDENSLKDYNEKTPTLLCLIINEFKRIDIDDCKALNNNPESFGVFKADFKRLRALAHNLGMTTWNKLLWQIGLFFVGIALFVIALFC